MRVVSNTSPLLHLSRIGRLGLINQLYEEVVVPPAVRAELLNADTQTPGFRDLFRAFDEGDIRVQPSSQRSLIQELLAAVDLGEAEAIALAIELDCLLLVDDLDARAEARRRGVLFTGTIGLLRDARDQGLIKAAYPLLDDLRQRGFRISGALIQQIRSEEAGQDGANDTETR